MTKMRVWAKRDNNLVLVYDVAQVRRLTKTVVPVYEDMSLKYSDVIAYMLIACGIASILNVIALFAAIIGIYAL